MKNRERYISRRNSYDMLCNIISYGQALDEDFCVIDALGAKGGTCVNGCEKCIQNWLNEEEKHDCKKM